MALEYRSFFPEFHRKSFVLGVVFAVGFHYALKTIGRRLWGKKKNASDRATGSDSCLLFSPHQVKWSTCLLNARVPCRLSTCSYCNHQKFVNLLRETTKSIDICVYLITSEDITNLLIEFLSQGIYVRIITDKQMSLQGKSVKVRRFLAECVPIKVIDTADIMHNKFAIIDQKMVITGSMNWTQQGFCRNYENAVVVHDKNVVKQFSDYFNFMWNECPGDKN